jgi:hypothetical protein
MPVSAVGMPVPGVVVSAVWAVMAHGTRCGEGVFGVVIAHRWLAFRCRRSVVMAGTAGSSR